MWWGKNMLYFPRYFWKDATKHGRFRWSLDARYFNRYKKCNGKLLFEKMFGKTIWLFLKPRIEAKVDDISALTTELLRHGGDSQKFPNAVIFAIRKVIKLDFHFHFHFQYRYQKTGSQCEHVGTRGVHRVGYKRLTRPDKIFNKPEHDPMPERRRPDDPNPTRQWIT